MPLWFDLLRTPMAAPETRGLRCLRLAWQTLCFSSALVIGFFGPLHRAVGRPAAVAAASLLAALLVCTAVYIAKKQRADRAFLEQIGEAE
ncbi:hypothetical protein [Novosphingobium sp. TCA1]|uniref:hypothetical protein n=1 Tax=Novosphingobium sp. TCA1 TaxID=2682474 RepID=UPI00130882AA|nr:hypothetical protein [Novosphingobium sp. TCA1]GFE76070.1 hypothetical protein NTCA1_37190 [Novosphingobium sp. TCA1]